ncbi:MAG: polysaccharide biosynthesis C-terminal domain-containing protein [Xanthomonadaceae bacterium]|nr:polysaccharide biosynthesis C-terminal domain-containing protein [Xanthomonadaceae bacterium]
MTGLRPAFVVNLAGTALSLLVVVALARLLGTDGYGIYAFAWALVSILATPAQAGLPMLVMRETARAAATGQYSSMRGIWIWSARVTAVLALLVAAVGVLVIVFGGEAVRGLQAQTIFWALVLVPLVALGNIRGAALRGLQRVVAGNLPEFVLRPALLLVLLGGAAAIGQALTPPAAMAMHATAAAAAFGAGAWLLAKSTPPEVRAVAPAYDGQRWLASTWPLALVAGTHVINLHADVLMLGIFAPASEVGVYRVAAQLAVFAAFGLAAVNMVVGPRFADLHARGETAQLQQLALRSARAVFAFSAAVVLCFAVAGAGLLEFVFGEGFDHAYLPLMILFIGQLVNGAVGSVGYLLNMTGHERDTARGIAIAAAVNVALNLLLIPRWGMHGAAAATAASMVTWNVLLWRDVKARLGINSFAFGLRWAR